MPRASLKWVSLQRIEILFLRVILHLSTNTHWSAKINMLLSLSGLMSWHKYIGAKFLWFWRPCVFKYKCKSSRSGRISTRVLELTHPIRKHEYTAPTKINICSNLFNLNLTPVSQILTHMYCNSYHNAQRKRHTPSGRLSPRLSACTSGSPRWITIRPTLRWLFVETFS